jgi:hypothetical protein
MQRSLLADMSALFQELATAFYRRAARLSGHMLIFSPSWKASYLIAASPPARFFSDEATSTCCWSSTKEKAEEGPIYLRFTGP